VAAYNQVSYKMIPDGSGGMIITWADRRNGTDWNIYAQRIDIDGNPLWMEDGVLVCSDAANQYNPVIVADGSGGAVIAWSDYRTPVEDSEVYAQRIDSDGDANSSWPANGVRISNGAIGDDYGQCMIPDGSGGAIIAYYNVPEQPFLWEAVVYNRVDGSGSVVWGLPNIVTNMEEDHRDPCIVSDGAGGAIIAWQQDIEYSDPDIYAQRVDNTGNQLWEYYANYIGDNGYADSPRIVSDGSGGAIIIWKNQPSGSGDMHAQRVDATGAPLWGIGGIDFSDLDGSPSQNSVVSDGSGGVVITWNTDYPGNIYAQHLNNLGSLLWGASGQLICSAPENQGSPTIISDSSGGWIITWYDYRNGTDYNIYAQRINGSGTDLWPTNGSPVCTATDEQTSPHIVADGSVGGAIIAWGDWRSGTDADIYAQRIFNELCEVTPTELDFGTVDIGSYSDLTFTIRNSGMATLSGSVTESCDHYDLITGGGPYSLGSDESLVVTVRFEPTAPGTHPCTIETGDALCSDVTCTGYACVTGIVYVDADAAGSGDGTSWSDAFVELRDALAMCQTCGSITEIWVAEGEYKPTGSSDRYATFQLLDGVSIYGGFNGTETMLSERDPEAYPTILSGNIGSLGSQLDNSYHVVNGSAVAASTVLDGFTVEKGYANGPVTAHRRGGGIYILDGSPTISNVSFVGNVASEEGGGMYCEGDDPVLTDIAFTSNEADMGGGVYFLNSNGTITNVIFDTNTATSTGGGMYNDGSSPHVFNAVFISNSADYAGGIRTVDSDLILINATLSNNTALSAGGGLSNVGLSHPEIINTIFWENIAPAGPEIVTTKVAEPVISRSIIENCMIPHPTYPEIEIWDESLGINGGGNNEEDPLFVSPGSDLHVSSGSPAIDTGSNSAPGLPSTDLDGNQRILPLGGYVDRGAYEFLQSVCVVEPTTLDFGSIMVGDYRDETFKIKSIGGETLSGTVSEACDHYSIVSGVGTYSLELGESLLVQVRFEPTTGGTHPCTIETGDDACIDVSLTGIGDCPAGTLYVDTDAAGAGNGSSWADAFPELRDALATALLCGGVTEIWVAEGTYTPTGDSLRTYTFELRSGLALYGGFAGTETSRGERDWAANVTTLSGDIHVQVESTDNSFHVVTANGVDATAVLDGFTITGGYAAESISNENGGGMYISSSSPTLANLIILDNYAAYNGGGVYNTNSSSSFSNVIFESNEADIGGGMTITSAGSDGAVLVDVSFIDNEAGTAGGGLVTTFSSPTLENVTFIGNSATWGGGLRTAQGSSSTVTNAIFIGNTTGSGGGGGGLCTSQDGVPVLTNVTFHGNSSNLGGGIAAYTGSPELVNVIMWGDSAITDGDEIYNDSGASPDISYSLVEGCGGSGGGWVPSFGTDGGGNIDQDPRFKIGHASDPPLSLWSSSPAINMGDNSAIPGGITTDIAGDPRIYDGIVDMGAYEYQGYSTDVEEDVPEVPKTFALYQNSPNPFNPTTMIRFDLPRAVHVKLCVYNVKGELVSTIVDRQMSEGQKEISWAARDNRGIQISSGIYFYRLIAGDFIETRKMVVLR
jgi:hypothetical protein